MKHFMWIFALVVLSSCSKETRLSIQTEGVTSDMLLVERSNFEERIMARGDREKYQRTIDTLILHEGCAELAFSARENHHLSLQFTPGEEGAMPASRIALILQPGEQVAVRIKKHRHGHLEAKVEGSALNAEIVKLDNSARAVHIDQYRVGRALNEAVAAKSSTVDSLRNRMMNIRTALHSIYAEYMKANPESEVSAYCLYQMGPKRGERYYRQLEPKVFKGVFRPVMKATESYLEDQLQRAELKAQIEEGGVAPDFALKDPKGKSVTLSSHRGKWVVLDFWGTWCSWCIKGMPRMKSAYEQYADKMEMIGVACGDKEETWRMAVERLKLPWIHVIDPMEAPVKESVAARYAVEGYPTKVIITPEGTIHKIFKGESKEFYEELKTLFE
ncbi:MAG: TlpA family protein disulfide reductase [Alistipes sp.]|nr:TlpA family protein disulfide reductase [Alistipes sp.]